MFVRVKTSKNSPKCAVQIVEALRTGKTVSQRIIRHVGTALNPKELQELKDLAELIKAQLEQASQPSLFAPETLSDIVITAKKVITSETELKVNIGNLREQQRVVTGIHEIYGEVYSTLGLDKIIPVRQFAANRDLRHTVMARIANPASKRQNVMDLAKHFGIELSLSSVYRMMDELDEYAVEKINKLALKCATTLSHGEIQVAFYDCTTLYFESFTDSEELLKKGYSKDLKFNQPQVVLALLATTSGIPLGYQLYPGNTFEGKTLKDALEKLKEQFKIKRVIFVADSAMLSAQNLELLEKENIEYVVGARLKSMAEEKLEKVFDSNGWQEFQRTEPEDEIVKFKEQPIECGRRLIVTYRENRAKKDKADRDKTINTLLTKMKRSTDPTSLISNFGYKKFIKLMGKSTLELDDQKIALAQRFDGMHGIISNIKDMSAKELKAQYTGLWEIEECFRISKHDLKFRPIFHWTDKRVKAHVAICFMTLMSVRYLQHQLRVQGHQYSIQTINRELNSIQASIVVDIETKKKYAIPSATSEIAHVIFKCFSKRVSHTPYEIPPD